MTDLIDRLRDGNLTIEGHPQALNNMLRLHREAANEIERLREALGIIAAQTSGIPVSHLKSDCLAAIANAALHYDRETSVCDTTGDTNET